MTNGNDTTYPVFDANGEVQEGRGLTKREAFAMAAMQGMLSANPVYTHGNSEMPVPSEIAVHSVNYADTLITALNQSPEPQEELWDSIIEQYKEETKASVFASNQFTNWMKSKFTLTRKQNTPP